jgi:hypothetical protein
MQRERENRRRCKSVEECVPRGDWPIGGVIDLFLWIRWSRVGGEVANIPWIFGATNGETGDDRAGQKRKKKKKKI